MNPNQNLNQFQPRVAGVTGSVHRPPGGSGSSGQSMGMGSTDKKWGDTTSKSGEISRVFVGNVDYKSVVCLDIEQRFQKYGTINGIDINPRGIAFVQFSRMDEAQRACNGENQTFFKNRKIEVKPFDKTGHPIKGRPNRERSRSPVPRRPTGGPTGSRPGALGPNMNGPFGEQFGYPGPGGPGGPEPPVVGNEAEIIVVEKEQWGYADMIEKRIKCETGIQLIDMLFLHSPTSLNMTLNDLFERQTFYALVIAPVNEEHMSVTLHVLHNQTEHRNMPLEDALLLISKDFQALTGRSGPPFPPPNEPPQSGGNGYKDGFSRTEPIDSKLPEEVAYLLRTILQENSSLFLSGNQLDLLIDYFQSEKSRMLAKNGPPVANALNTLNTGQQQAPQPLDYDKQRATLLDNPHVQAALSSLLQIGALNSGNNAEQNPSANQSINNNNIYQQLSAQFGAQQQNNNPMNVPTRRHPLLGTELSANKPQIAGAPGGLVGYPPPQSYNQFNQYKF